jgi:alanyl aminopeptidase
LKLVQTFAGDPERQVVQSALGLALQPVQHEVPENLMPNYRRFLLKNFEAKAKEVGWTPKPNESDDIRLLRPPLVRLMATYGGDKELAAQGTELANKWLNDHTSVNPNLASSVLSTAAFYGDKPLFDRFLASLKTTKDRQERGRIISAMSSFRDPAAITAGYEAVLSGEVPFIEGVRLLFAGQSLSSTREMAFDFMKAHFDEIMEKRPTGGGFEPRVDKITGAKRTLSNVLESIDDCIAQKAEQEPSVVAFLQSY